MPEFKPRDKKQAIAFVTNQLFKLDNYVRTSHTVSNCIDRAMEYFLGLLQLVESMEDVIDGFVISVMASAHSFEFITLETYLRQRYPEISFEVRPHGAHVKHIQKVIHMKCESVTLHLDKVSFWYISLCVATIENGRVVMKSCSKPFRYDKKWMSRTFRVARVYNIPVGAKAYCVSYKGSWYIIDPLHMFSIEPKHEEDSNLIPRFNRERHRPEGGFLVERLLIPVAPHLNVFRVKSVTEYMTERHTDAFASWF